MIRRLIAPLMLIVLVMPFRMAWAQNAFPAPLPGPQATPPLATFPIGDSERLLSSPSRGPSPKGTVDLFNRRAVAQTPSYPIRDFTYPPPDEQVFPGECASEYHALWGEAMRRGKFIESARAGVACSVIGAFSEAERKVVQFVESRGEACGISQENRDKLADNHIQTVRRWELVCADPERFRRLWLERNVHDDGIRLR